MPIVETEAVIIKGWDYEEYDMIVVCYTRSYGKLSVIVKGVKKPKSRLSCCFEPFTYINLSFLRKENASLYRAITADIIDPFLKLKDNFQSLISSFYLLDLLNEASRMEEINNELFELVIHSLRLINSGLSLENVFRIFEIKLIHILGFNPSLNTCLVCKTRIKNTTMRFNCSKGGLLCDKCAVQDKDNIQISAGSIKFFRQAIDMDLEEVRKLHITKSLNEELKNILAAYLSFHLEIPPKSYPFVDII